MYFSARSQALLDNLGDAFYRSMLYGLRGNDPMILVGAAGLLFAVALLSGWRPARRASRIEPMEALRHE
jgi:ABC-type antimicrobial peptide transport system permease subunit